MISVLEQWRLTCDYAIWIHKTLQFQYFHYFYYLSDRRVQGVIGTKNPETAVGISDQGYGIKAIV